MSIPEFVPEFVIERREKLRQRALNQAYKALLAVEKAGGHAVVFGSVLKAGKGGFQEGSDIDICLLKPSKSVWDTDSPDSAGFWFSLVEGAIDGFPADISWFDELRPHVKEKVEMEGTGLDDLAKLVQ